MARWTRQPLYANNMPGPLGTQNTLFVVTEHDSIYAFDADSGTQTWKVSALLPGKLPATIGAAARLRRK